jgi:hypothetical protein
MRYQHSQNSENQWQMRSTNKVFFTEADKSISPLAKLSWLNFSLLNHSQKKYNQTVIKHFRAYMFIFF